MTVTRTDVEHRLAVPAGPPVLALGAWFKNTVCALSGRTALVSATVGDLDGVDACLAHEDQARAYLELCDGAPAVIAHDLHPDFHSTRFAEQLAAELGVPALPVQHHHAHVAAVQAEHGLDVPVVGLALDGVGLGTDGTAWGGELLWVDGHRWERLAGLRPLRLPGGDRAAREPWRMAASVLDDLGRGEEIAIRYADQPAAAGLGDLLARGVRCPPTSSLGRVFDAAAGLLGLSRVMRMEAEAAIALEEAAAGFVADHGPVDPMPGGWTDRVGGELDLHPVLATLADEEDPERGAARFHATVGAALADWVIRAARSRGVAHVAVGGGCLFNRILRADLRRRVGGAGLTVLEPTELLPGDTAIAFGQAVIARSALAAGDPVTSER